MKTFALQFAFLMIATSLFGSASKNSPGCDTLYLYDGRVVLVENLIIGNSKLTYIPCNEVNSGIHVTKWGDVLKVAKSDGSTIAQPAEFSTKAEPVDEVSIEKEIDGYLAFNIVSVFAFLFPPAIIGAFVVLSRSKKLLRKIAGHEKEAVWKKKIMRHRLVAGIIAAIFTVLLIVSFILVIGILSGNIPIFGGGF
jgi:hypothetical protein